MTDKITEEVKTRLYCYILNKVHGYSPDAMPFDYSTWDPTEYIHNALNYDQSTEYGRQYKKEIEEILNDKVPI